MWRKWLAAICRYEDPMVKILIRTRRADGTLDDCESMCRESQIADLRHQDFGEDAAQEIWVYRLVYYHPDQASDAIADEAIIPLAIAETLIGTGGRVV